MSVLKESLERNLTNEGFFIQKGKIVTKTESGRISLLFTMKYNFPDKYLISLRGLTGIEAYRILIAGDTILINDRINEELIIGNKYDFERIAGIATPLLKIAVGDCFFNQPELAESGKCNKDELKLSDYFLGMVIKTTIDCGKKKPVSVLLTTGDPSEFINIEYRKHRDDLKRLPRIIEVKDFRRKVEISLSLNKYSSPWFGDVEFIPGAGYKIRPLI